MAYASPDRDRAGGLFEALTAAGLEVCFDQEVLRPGDDWHALLPGNLRGSAVVVALVSSSFDEAHFERSELLQAINMVRREGGRLVPVRLAKDVQLPYGTEMLHAIDMFEPGDVAGAAARIAGLFPKLDTVQPLNVTQVVSDRIPPKPRFFTGRDDLLERLAGFLQPGTTKLVTQEIQGLGGVGKTSLAAALVEAHRHEFDIVWWVRSEDPTQLVANLAELAPHFGLPVLDELSEMAAAVRCELEATDRAWLVVFDNAPDQRSIAAWLPRRGQGAVVITSRSSAFPDVDEVVDVDTFPPEVSEQFLRRRVQQRNPRAATENLEAVLDRLGGLPLALEQAGAWVAEARTRTFARFVQLYDNAAKDPFPDGTRPIDYEHTATTTWRVSIDAATTKAPQATHVMALLGYMAPDGLPSQWLHDVASDDYFDHAGPDAIDDAVDALAAYSLVSPGDTDENISVHRVVQLAARRSAPPDALAAAVHTLRVQALGDAQNHLRWPTLAALTPHALALADYANAPPPDTVEELWWVLKDVARYQRVSGNVRASVNTATCAVDITTARLGPEHPASLTSRNDLARALRAAGEVDRATSLFEAILADRERILGNDHLHTLVSRNDLARSYEHQGKLDRAMALIEATVADCERIFGSDHPHTLSNRNSLAYLYDAVGEVERAISLYEANLADRERILGSDHPNTLISRSNLAHALDAAGNLDEAIVLYEATLADRERVLGSDHPDTVLSRHSLDTARRAQQGHSPA